MKRAGRYLRSPMRLAQCYEWAEDHNSKLVGFADSDWAGDRRDMKSTSGGVILWGRHCMKAWSTSQSTVALSSGEAELYAMTKASIQIGGGGGNGQYGGGGSGYVETVVIDISSTEYEVTVGRESSYSYVKNNEGEFIISALPGEKGSDPYGGNGYSGGGGQGSKGGSNGSDGEGSRGGSGTGTDISEISLNHFVLSPGDGGDGSYHGGGGGGILVDNFGSDSNDYQGKGYGGGAGGYYYTYGHPGMVLIEVNPK